jgi:hypothetical protein
MITTDSAPAIDEAKLSELASEAGYSDVWQAQMENPFNNLYALKP